jgi:hypothetical protein
LIASPTNERNERRNVMNEQVQQLRVLAAQIAAVADQLEGTPAARAPAPRPAAAPPAGGLYGGPPIAGSGPCAPPFGKNAGQPLSQLEVRDLRWYADCLARSIDDVTKAKYRAKNEALLAEIHAEMGRRG